MRIVDQIMVGEDVGEDEKVKTKNEEAQRK
jgi:hypothetical protein